MDGRGVKIVRILIYFVDKVKNLLRIIRYPDCYDNEVYIRTLRRGGGKNR